MEEFVCHLYGFREKDTNTIRYQIFTKKNKQERKVVDLSVLPPCKSVLYYHKILSFFMTQLWLLFVLSQKCDKLKII